METILSGGTPPRCFLKVNSHQRGEEAGDDEGLRRLIVGNDAADTVAKAAVQCVDPLGGIDSAAQWRSVTAVLRYVAQALSRFPYAIEQYAEALSGGRIPRSGTARRGRSQPNARHRFVWSGGAW